MRRRNFITLVGGAAALWPLAARGQLSTERPLIAYLAGGKQAVVSDLVNAFRDGLRELGHDEGRNVHIVYRFAEGREERLPGLAEELVRLKPAIILTGAVDSAVAAKKVTIRKSIRRLARRTGSWSVRTRSNSDSSLA
jgi:putative ABC transport system substrate-binding protein